MVNKLSHCSVTEYEIWSISCQTALLQNPRYGQYVIRLLCYKIRGTVNKLSDCSVTECEVWSISYQTLLVKLVELHVNENLKMPLSEPVTI